MRKKFRKLPVRFIVSLVFVFCFAKYMSEDWKVVENEEVFEYVEYCGPYEVSYVYDGDTIAIIKNGEEIKVRFIGVDTPESVHKDASLNTEEGKKASSFTKELLEGHKVYLAYDMDEKDDYDRTLAYVYTEDKVMVNALLLEKGYARCMSIEPNTLFEDEFSKLERLAKKENAGFWGTGFFE